MSGESTESDLPDESSDVDEWNYVRLELLRLVAHCVELLIHYGLRASPQELLWESPTDSGGKPIYSYSYDESDFVRIGREVAANPDLPYEHRIAGMAAPILIEDLLPAVAEATPTWKLTSWSVLLSALIPDPTADTEKADRLAHLLEVAEPLADSALKSRRAASEGGKVTSEKFAKNRNYCKKEGLKIHADKPGLKKRSIAAIIARRVGGSDEVIRRNTETFRKYLTNLW